VATFLSTVTRYHASIRHIAGVNNSLSDFGSRNTKECDAPNCQICSFINELSDSVVRSVSIQDLMAGRAKIPYLSRSAWHASQQECPALRRTHAHLKSGTRPSRKATDVKDVKRYINVATIARDGLIVVKSKDAYSTGERIVIPRSAVDGLLTALHIKLKHPKLNQLKTVCHRYFYALDLDKRIELNINSCHLCASLKNVPHTLSEQSSSDPPEVVGVSFSTDIIKREKLNIMVVREYITSFTSTTLIPDESHQSLREGLIQLTLPLLPLGGPSAVVRADNATGFQRLENDPILSKHNISLEFGRRKNINKNPIAERAVQEMEEEISKLEPGGRAIDSTTLSVATCNLNSKLRNRGLSSREMLFQRDQFTHRQIPVKDLDLIEQQQELKKRNQPSSAYSKNPKKYLPTHTIVEIGDLVYLYSDRDKHRARDRYLVVSVDGDWCNIRKFAGDSLRKFSYRVKYSDCYKVPVSTQTSYSNYNEESDDASDAENTPQTQYIPSSDPLKIQEPYDYDPLESPDIPEDISGDIDHSTAIQPSIDTTDAISTPSIEKTTTNPTPTRMSSRPRKRAQLYEGSVCSLCLNNPCSCIS